MSSSKAFMWTTQEELTARVVDSLERLITLYATNSTKDSFRAVSYTHLTLPTTPYV